MKQTIIELDIFKILPLISFNMKNLYAVKLIFNVMFKSNNLRKFMKSISITKAYTINCKPTSVVELK